MKVTKDMQGVAMDIIATIYNQLAKESRYVVDNSNDYLIDYDYNAVIVKSVKEIKERYKLKHNIRNI